MEYGDEKIQRLGVGVTNNGYSDWSSADIDAFIKCKWFRLSGRGSDFRIESSADGVHFDQMRICHLFNGSGKVRFGLFACSAEDSSFKAVFTDMELSECRWPAYDGQPPDEDC